MDEGKEGVQGSVQKDAYQIWGPKFLTGEACHMVMGGSSVMEESSRTFPRDKKVSLESTR